MSTWSARAVRFVCIACLLVGVTALRLWGQDPASSSPAAPAADAASAPVAESPKPEGAPQPATESPKPEEAPQPAAESPKPEEAPQPAAESPKSEEAPKPAAAPAFLPLFDYARLAHPAVADQLELTNEQRAAVAQLVNERAAALAAAPADQRTAVVEATDQKLAALLNDAQRAKLATMAGTQKLRFSFRYQKWDDVLDWFARQAGLALVMDQPPAGLFTYSDNREYSPAEAIDLLNSVLLTRGFTLIQRGRMLVLVDLSKDLQQNLIPRLKPEEIAQRGNFEFVTVMFPLGRRKADDVAKEITPLLGSYGTCVALPQTAQLQVTGPGGVLKAISILISSIPEPPLPKTEEPRKPPPQIPPVLAVYPVTAIDPAAAVKTLEVLFPGAKFQIDEKVDQIMAYGTPNEQTAIKAAVDQMQANRPPDKQPRLEIYQLRGLEAATVTDLVEQLQAVIPKVQATVDTASERLLVFAEPKDQEQVKAMMLKLGADVEEGGKQVVVYMPKRFDPTAFAALVKELVPRADISSDPKTRRVVVSASEAAQTMVKSLADQLDQEAALEDTPVLQLYSFDKAMDDAVLALISPLVPDAKLTLSSDGLQLTAIARVVDHTVIKRLVDQWKETRAAQEDPTLHIYPLSKPLNATILSTLTTLVPGAQITPSSDSKQLIVVARAEDHERVQQTLDQISVSAEAAKRLKLEFYQVAGMPATQLQTLLQPLVIESTITVDSAQDRLIVWGPAEEHATLAELVERLAEDPLAGSKPVLEFYPLPDEAMSTSITSVLATMAPTARVTWDAETSRLMVVATPKEQQIVKQTIEQVTTGAPRAEKQELRPYPLDMSQRAWFHLVQADLLQRFPGMRVIEDPESGEIAIWAKAAQHEELARLVKSAGAASDAAEPSVLIKYPMRRGSAKTAFDMLKQLYPTLKVTLDEKADCVLVYAPLSMHGRLKQALGQVAVDVAPGNQEELRSYATGAVSPTALITALQKLLPDMQITTDTASQKLIAFGTLADHELLAKALEQFLEDDAAQRPTVVVYPAKARSYEALSQLRSVLTQVAPQAVIGIDVRRGAIVAAAQEADHAKIRAAIEQVVAMDREAESRLETYTLDRIKATPTLTALQMIAPYAQMSVGAVPEQIVVWGTPEDHDRVKAALAKLEETGGADASRELRVHKIHKQASAQAASVIATTLPEVQVLAGQGSDQLLIWASPKDHARLDELIKQLEKELRLDVDREVKVFELQDVDPAEARRVLDATIGGLEYVTTTVPRRLVVRADPALFERIEQTLADLQQAVAVPEQVVRVHTYDVDELNVSTLYAALSADDMKELSIQLNPTTNSLIVRGPAARQDELAATLSQLALQLPAPDKPTAEVYRLERADVTTAATTIRSLVPTALVMPDTVNQTLAITATAKDHAKIKDLVDRLDSSEGGELVTETYVLKKAYPPGIVAAVKPIVPQAIFSPDPYNKSIIVTATAADQQKIKAIIDKADGLGEGELTTKVYSLEWVSPYAIMTALTPIVPNATLSPDAASKSLIVSANEKDHERVEAVIKQADQRGGGEWTTKAYPMKWANASTISVALASVVPDAKVSPDPTNKMLIVTASNQDHTKIQAVLDEADKRGGAGDLVTKAYPLRTANPYAIVTALTPVVPNATISADPTNQMIVATASEDDHTRIKAIVDEADRREDGEITTVVYPLKWANPSALTLSIKPVAPTAVVSPDVYNKTLIVSATAKDHALIKPIIDQADTRGGGELVTTAYPLKWANASTISAALASVVPDAKVSPDPTNKMLIVTASEDDHQRIVAVLEQADKRGGAGDLVTKAYKLRTANAYTIVTALTPVVPNATISADPTNQMIVATASEEDQKRIKAIVDEADGRLGGTLITEVYNLKWANPLALSTSIKPIAPNAVVSPDVYNKTLIVSATAKDHARIKPVIDQADTRGGGELVTTAYPLKWANASTISAALLSVVPDAKVSPDPTNKMLIVTASEDDHTRIKAVLAEADKRGGGGELVTKAYALRTANPYTIVTALTPVVPNATISADATNQMIVATASEEDHTRIKAIVDEADRRQEGEVTTVVYPLKWANPVALSTSIKPVAPTAVVSPDVYNKTLIVSATAKDHALIKPIIDQADTRGGGELVTTAYPLKWANASTISAALLSVVPDAKVSPDPTNKMLIVTASEDDHKRIVAVLEQADKRGGAGDLVTKAYTLQTANPSTIMAALTPVVPNATISVDPINQMLVATASEEDHTRIKAIVDEADRRQEGEVTTVVYPLKWANPVALSTSIKPIAPTAITSPDVYNKTLIVSATAKDHARIKPVIDQADTRGGEELTTKAYPVKWANPSTIYSALTTVVPDAKVSPDPTNKMLIVTASEDDHKRIESVLEQADKRGGAGDLVTKAYTLQTANPSTIMAALTPVVPNATISVDPINQMLVATASEEDHRRIESIVDEADRRSEGKPVTQVYRLKWANPTAISTSIKPIAPQAIVSPDVANKTLIVTANLADHVRIKQVVEQADRRGEGELTTEVYAFKVANPTTIATALATLMPNATLSSDPNTNTLIVTASAADHQMIQPLMKQLDVTDPKAAILKPYMVQNADPQKVYQALTGLFRTGHNVSVGYQQETGMILVYAPPVDQQEVERAIQDIDRAIAGRPKATLEVYPLEGLDGHAAVESLSALLVNETPKVDLQMDLTNNQILAIAEPRQHEVLKRALAQLIPEQREVEVFPLRRIEPFTAQSAINTLFADLPVAATPSVEADPNTQQLMVRATQSQLNRIRELLDKLGEGPSQTPNGRPATMLRILPMTGNVENVLRQIERIWPQVSGNPIQVVMPTKPQPEADHPPGKRENAPPEDDATSKPTPPERPPTPPADPQTDPTTPDAQPVPGTQPATGDRPLSDIRPSSGIVLVSDVRPVSDVEPAPDVQPAPAAQSAPDIQTPHQAQSAPNVQPAPEAQPVPDVQPAPGVQSSSRPPIVVIAGEGQITVACQDAEALSQFETLFRTLQRGRRTRIETGNYSMFLLQNADAKQLSEVINDLFQRGPRGGAGGDVPYRGYARRTRLTVVADERMNALLVYGSIADRDAIEEMLDVLDSMDIPESLNTPRPKMIPIKNLPAATILTVLQTVYKTQLTARTGVRPMTIPQGLSFEMTSMLQLINAAAEAPLLTLDVDETTNSIVMRAPRQLSEEIEEFTKQLDDQAKTSGTRSISLVPLKSMGSEQLQDALRMVMPSGRPRRRP